MSRVVKRRNRSSEDIPKKKCLGKECGKERSYTFFYKVDSAMFPDGMINICRDCVRKQVDVDDVQSVLAFLRQIDKPFYQDEWEKSLETRDKKHPIGAYMQKMSLPQYKGKTFDDSDGIEASNVDLNVISSREEIETEAGEIITYEDGLVSRWGLGYKKYEYLRLEKFYQDMMDSYDVITANHKQMLAQLAKLTLEMDNLLNIKDYNSYSKVSKAYDDLLKSAGFRPIDRKNGAEATGIYSFSQVWAEIEREGFIEPKMVHYDKDDIDYMLLYYIQFAQRLSGKAVSVRPPKNWRQEVIVHEDDE